MKRIEMAWTVECMEPDCGWAYANIVKTDVEWQAKAHRQHHMMKEAERLNAQAELAAAQQEAVRNL